MATEDSAVDPPNESVNINEQAAEDAKNLLAELQAEEATNEDSNTKSDLNGADEPKTENGEAEDDTKEQDIDEVRETGAATEEKEAPRQRDTRGSSNRGGRGGSRGGKFKSYKENIKSDLTSQETSSDPEAIRKQMEFYFSDSNLPMDKFLLGKVGGNQNNPVEISIIHSFKRMRRFQPFEAIVEALKDSKTLQLTDDNTKVQRKSPLPIDLENANDDGALKVFEDKAMPRSVYVKGFGEEVPSTQFDIEAFFAEYGPTNAIRLRRTDEKIFKGSVFVEFENEDLSKKFLELDPKPQYHGKDLKIMSKKAYCDQKVEDIKAGRIRRNDRSYNNRSSRGGRGGRDRRKRDDEDDRDWRERRDEDRKNGFRNDRRRGNREHRSEGRNRDSATQKGEKDDRGVPVVKTTTEAERKAMKEEALSKAKAAVEAENKKKRDREDDTISEEPATKKIDTKEEVDVKEEMS